MKYEITYSPIAIDDLDCIYDEVFQASLDENIANNYINELIDTIEIKADFPYSGTPLFFKNSLSIFRYVVYKSYIAFYYIENETIFVYRVLYSKSDYLQKLKIASTK